MNIQIRSMLLYVSYMDTKCAEMCSKDTEDKYSEIYTFGAKSVQHTCLDCSTFQAMSFQVYCSLITDKYTRRRWR